MTPIMPREDPTNRFSGLADAYARHRPTYPDAALKYILAKAGLAQGSVLVDVGCGTGISTRQMAALGLRVIGIEPNREMRGRAAAEPAPAGAVPPEYRYGRAEATGLAAACADAVLAAQAFHWFEPEAAFAEFHRILRPGKWVALLWNERDESDPFTAAYGEVFRSVPETAKVEGPRGQAGNALLHTPWFEDCERVVFRHGQELDEEGVLGRAFSASYAPKDPERAEKFAAQLRRTFASYQRDGRVALRYESSVYLGRRRNQPDSL
jgi:SAM-dependent methyltransferase